MNATSVLNRGSLLSYECCQYTDVTLEISQRWPFSLLGQGLGRVDHLWQTGPTP